MGEGREGGNEGRGEKERNINLFLLFMHSLVDSCMCPDWGSNSQPCSVTVGSS